MASIDGDQKGIAPEAKLGYHFLQKYAFFDKCFLHHHSVETSINMLVGTAGHSQKILACGYVARFCQPILSALLLDLSRATCQRGNINLYELFP